jgi:anti-sigma factor RsiW
MTTPDFDDETLMAFADGEADEITAARVARTMAGNPAIVARVEMLRAARAKVAQSMKPLIDEPVPPGLKMSVEAMIERDLEARALKVARERATEQNVVELAPRVTRRASFRAPPWLAPLAASIVLMIGAAGGYVVGVTMPGQVQAEFASIQDPAIIKALSEIPSGAHVDLQSSGRTLEPVLSFRLEDGTLCREYKLREANAKGVISIACLDNDRWQTHLLMAAAKPEEGYVPAGSAETIDAYLASIHAGSPLDGTAEEEALRSIRN